ncbi:MAG: adenine nucleotide alpha hydrolase [Candidatus Nezhaarchaeota archaeon]|nr:adenine nucleotide alpha hydrolase [Candidatus Nezhaarchaeota archaeon]
MSGPLHLINAERRVVVSWSGGKDSALSLYEVAQHGSARCVGLLTVAVREYDRVAMHGVRRELVERQAALLNLPLDVVYIPERCSMGEYGELMRGAARKYRAEGVEGFVFGDIYLEDVRSYRESMLALEGLKAFFPLWGRRPREVVKEFLRLGFRALVTSVDGTVLTRSHVGRELDEEFVESLPENADPCGERGEYHTFVYEGPVFAKPIPVRAEEVVEKEVEGKRFYYCDLQLSCPT